MASFNCSLGADSLAELQRAQLELSSAFAPSSFKWKSEYFAFVAAAGGLVLISLLRKYRKKKAGKK